MTEPLDSPAALNQGDDRIPEDLVQGLAQDFSPLDTLGPCLAEDALAYVLTGAPEVVLTQLEGTRFQEALGLNKEGGPVTLGPQARVGLVHAVLLDPEIAGRWAASLADYEVKPLLQQLGEAAYRLPEGAEEETEVRDFAGHRVWTFPLRALLGKRGYAMGGSWGSDDGVSYEKRFPSLGLTAIIGLAETTRDFADNQEVTLTTLSFEDRSGVDGHRLPLPLGRVPPVLLCECFNDLRLAAAERSGPTEQEAS